jgi:hypothetical protein
MRVAKPGIACAVAGGIAKTKETAKVESTYLIVLLPESRSWIQYARFAGMRVRRLSKFLPAMKGGAGTKSARITGYKSFLESSAVAESAASFPQLAIKDQSTC